MRFLRRQLAQHVAAERIREKRVARAPEDSDEDRKSTRLNSSHLVISYAVFCLKKKKSASLHPHSPPTLRPQSSAPHTHSPSWCSTPTLYPHLPPRTQSTALLTGTPRPSTDTFL